MCFEDFYEIEDGSVLRQQRSRASNLDLQVALRSIHNSYSEFFLPISLRVLIPIASSAAGFIAA